MIRFGLPLVAIGAGLGLATSVRATTFDVIRAGPDDLTLMNRAAIERIGDGAVRRVVSVAVKRSLVSGGPPQPGYVTTIIDYDCTAWAFHWRSFAAFSRFGAAVLRKDNDDPAWTPIAGDIEASAAARIVCDGAVAKSVYAASSIGQLVTTLMNVWDAEAPLPPLQPVEAPPAPAPRPAKPHARPHAKPSKAP